jgi:hypothetical protein
MGGLRWDDIAAAEHLERFIQGFAPHALRVIARRNDEAIQK